MDEIMEQFLESPKDWVAARVHMFISEVAKKQPHVRNNKRHVVILCVMTYVLAQQ